MHIANYYENQPLHISHWSQSLVIKGLLKQVHNGFDIARAWNKILRNNPDYERFLEWLEPELTVLRRKLEFHEGTPHELAAEAFRLAKGPEFLKQAGLAARNARSHGTPQMEFEDWNPASGTATGNYHFPSSSEFI